MPDLYILSVTKVPPKVVPMVVMADEADISFCVVTNNTGHSFT